MNDKKLREYVRIKFVQSGFITVHQWKNFIDYLQILLEKDKLNEIEKSKDRQKDNHPHLEKFYEHFTPKQLMIKRSKKIKHGIKQKNK